MFANKIRSPLSEIAVEVIGLPVANELSKSRPFFIRYRNRLPFVVPATIRPVVEDIESAETAPPTLLWSTSSPDLLNK